MWLYICGALDVHIVQHVLLRRPVTGSSLLSPITFLFVQRSLDIHQVNGLRIPISEQPSICSLVCHNTRYME